MILKDDRLIGRNRLLDRNMTVDWLRRQVVEYASPPIFNDTDEATAWVATLPDDAIVDADVQDPLSGRIFLSAGQSKNDVKKDEG